MQEYFDSLANQLLFDLALVLVTLMASVVMGKLAGFLHSREVKGYAEAIKAFDEDLYSALVSMAHGLEAMARDEANEFITDNTKYHHLRTSALDFINDSKKRTGIRKDFTEAQLDALLVSAFQAAGQNFPPKQPPSRLRPGQN